MYIWIQPCSTVLINDSVFYKDHVSDNHVRWQDIMEGLYTDEHSNFEQWGQQKVLQIILLFNCRDAI